MLKAVIIGAGVIGGDHARAYANIKNVKLAAISDIDAEKGKAAADKVGCKYYQDAEEMLQTEQVDFVDICLPSFLHEEYVLLAAKYKKHILCEKPATLSLASMDNMINAAKEAGVRLMVAQVVRFWPEYMEIKRRYDAGDLGDIKMVYANRLAQHPNWANWHTDPAKSGGGLFDLHLHDIDYLQSLFGKVKNVYAVGSATETGCWNYVATTLRFQNRRYATAEGVFGMTENYPFTMTFRIVGAAQTLDYQMVAGFNLEDVGNAQRAVTKYEAGQQPQKLDIEAKDAYQIEIEYFAGCIENNKPFEVITPEDSRHVIQVVEAIRESLETGQVVEVDK